MTILREGRGLANLRADAAAGRTGVPVYLTGAVREARAEEHRKAALLR